jgi:hypothetical protein
MIYFLTTRLHTYTVECLLQSPWGESFQPHVRLIPYETLLQAKKLPKGSYIFSDIDRLTPAETEQIAQVWQSLAMKLPTAALLNHPIRSMRRYQLLRTLNEVGINQFNVYHLTEARLPKQFPVFIRGENDHNGPQSELLHSQIELENEIETFVQKGKSLVDKIITEFCPTADDKGITRKYSAVIIGKRILPRHVFFSSKNLILKLPDLIDSPFIEEEAKYLAENPHAEELRTIFDIAKINFGRIDYGYINGKIQVWEINTNPLLLWPIANKPEDDARLAVHTKFAEQMLDALLELNAVSETVATD